MGKGIATCSICGEPVMPYVDAQGSVLLHAAGPEHWRIGYEREKARADAATAKAEQYERDWYAAKNDFGTAMAKSREALAAARRECEGLTSSVVHLRLVGTQMATFIEEQMPLFGGASSEFDGEGEPRELLKKWRKADKIADKSYGPAVLAAPAAGEEG